MSMKGARNMVLLAALTLLVPLSTWARSQNARNVTIPETVKVGSTQLKAGTYKIEWQGNHQSLRVSFLENGKTVATAQGKMVEKIKRANEDAFVMKAVGNTKMLEEIDFGGMKDALVFTSDQTAMK
jgi:hypothetical protein